MEGSLEYVWLVANLLVLISSAVLNGVLLIAVCWNRLLLQRRYGILISLAVADILKVIPMLAQMVSVLMDAEQGSITACMVASGTGLLLIGISILHLVLESVNRLLAIIRPLRYNAILSQKVFSLLLALVWLIPLLGVVGPYAVFTKPSMWHSSLRVIMFSCDVSDSVDFQFTNETINSTLMEGDLDNKEFLVAYSAVNTILFFLIPIIIMAICYSIIFKISLQHIRQIRKLEVGMRRLKHKYSNQRQPSLFGSQISCASSVAYAEEDNLPKSHSFIGLPRKSRRNSIAPIAQKEALGTHELAARSAEVSTGHQAEFASGNTDLNIGCRTIGIDDDNRINSETASASSFRNVLEFVRIDDTINNDTSTPRRHSPFILPIDRFDNARKSEDSGHGTISQISNLVQERMISNENLSREHSASSASLIRQPAKPTTTDEKPFYNLTQSNLSDAATCTYDENISTIQLRDAVEENVTNDNKEQDETNISMMDLFNLLAGFSVMGAWAETVRAKSATPQNSFSRFHGIVKEELRDKRKEIKLVKTLGGLMAAWVLFYVPILIFSWERLHNWPANSKKNDDIGRFLLSWALFNSALNPIIYCLRLAEFRNSVKQVVKGIRDLICCRR